MIFFALISFPLAALAQVQNCSQCQKDANSVQMFCRGEVPQKYSPDYNADDVRKVQRYNSSIDSWKSQIREAMLIENMQKRLNTVSPLYRLQQAFFAQAYYDCQESWAKAQLSCTKDKCNCKDCDQAKKVGEKLKAKSDFLREATADMDKAAFESSLSTDAGPASYDGPTPVRGQDCDSYGDCMVKSNIRSNNIEDRTNEDANGVIISPGRIEFTPRTPASLTGALE
ncbi:MAG: hypothetical protein C5B49_02410 [Bdellovibrio sp.]|nr:MAG: hypothetical protein C5B49_02410 [Bdellovibrio sp.]